jgi:hypothetical protein
MSTRRSKEFDEWLAAEVRRKRLRMTNEERAGSRHPVTRAGRRALGKRIRAEQAERKRSELDRNLAESLRLSPLEKELNR